MDLRELFRRLSYGELSHMFVGLDGAGGISEDKQNQLIYYTNEALLRLYSRFLLREEEVIIQMESHITNYHFNSRYAESNPDRKPGDFAYIKDAAQPFRNDLLKVLSVYDENGDSFDLNDTSKPLSLYTPQPLVLQNPYPSEGNILLSLIHI